MFRRWRKFETRDMDNLVMAIRYFENTEVKGYAIIKPPINLKPGVKYSDFLKISTKNFNPLPPPIITIYLKSTRQEYDFFKERLLGIYDILLSSYF